MSQADWFVQHGTGEYVSGICQKVAHLVGWVVVTILMYFTCAFGALLKRFLQVKYGKRLQPDGSKAVIITGATSGFGLATAKRMYQRGFTVFACYYNDQEAGYEELVNLKAENRARASEVGRRKLFLIRMDLRSSESVGRSAQEVKDLLDEHGLKLHCLLNNAAVCLNGPFELVTSQIIRNLLDTNLAGPYQVTREFILRIIKDKGRVVNVSSGIYSFPGMGFSLYGSSKAAVSYFSDSLNQDLEPYGAACYTIVPGKFLLHSNIVLTRVSVIQNSIAQLSDEERKVYKSKIDSFGKSLSALLKAKLARSKESARRLAQLYKIELPVEGEKANTELVQGSTQSLLQRAIALLVSLSDGGICGRLELEETGVIDCFESAVTLIEPPRFTYAGNTFYQFITGPILDYLPRFVMHRLGHNMMSHLDSTK